MFFQLHDTNNVVVPTSVALLIVKDVGMLLLNRHRYKNGTDRRLTEDKVRVIIQEELQPVNSRLYDLGCKISGLGHG